MDVRTRLKNSTRKGTSNAKGLCDIQRYKNKYYITKISTEITKHWYYASCLPLLS